MKQKIKIGISTIILTSALTYFIQHWLKHSGVEEKILNKYDDVIDFIQNEINGDKK